MPSRASDMAQQGFTVLSAKAVNGEVVHINGARVPYRADGRPRLHLDAMVGP